MKMKACSHRPLQKHLPRAEADELIQANMKNIMEGKTMIVGFYIRGPVGAPTAYPSLTISDTWYLAHQQDNLYRCSPEGFEKQVEKTGLFFTNTHSKGSLDTPKAYVLTDRKNIETWAWNVSYLGNCAFDQKKVITDCQMMMRFISTEVITCQSTCSSQVLK